MIIIGVGAFLFHLHFFFSPVKIRSVGDCSMSTKPSRAYILLTSFEAASMGRLRTVKRTVFLMDPASSGRAGY